MKIAITCPVYERAWVLPRWYKCVLAQGIKPKNIDLIFGLTDGEDETRTIIQDFQSYFGSTRIIECNDLPSFRGRDQGRFEILAHIRNRILESIESEQYDLWFSYDSDILIPDGCLKTLIKDIKSKDVDIVAPYVELMPRVPNCATRRQNSDQFWRRTPYGMFYPQGSFYEVQNGTVFAIFLAKPKVFAFRYGWHEGGEDFYWGNQMLDNGIRSWMDSRVICEHIFRRDC